MRIGWRVAVIVVLAVAGACTSGGGTGSGPGSADSSSAEDAIAAFDLRHAALAESLAAVNESAFADPDSMREAALASLEADDPARRFAAVYALTLTVSTDVPDSLDAIREVMASGDPTERFLAAGALASLGDPDAVAMLIEALGSDEPMHYLAPPMPAWRYARANLLLFVGQDLGLRGATDAAAAAAAGEAWRAWWSENAQAMTWNGELGRFDGPAQ